MGSAEGFDTFNFSFMGLRLIPPRAHLYRSTILSLVKLVIRPHRFALLGEEWKMPQGRACPIAQFLHGLRAGQGMEEVAQKLAGD